MASTEKRAHCLDRPDRRSEMLPFRHPAVPVERKERLLERRFLRRRVASSECPRWDSEYSLSGLRLRMGP